MGQWEEQGVVKIPVRLSLRPCGKTAQISNRFNRNGEGKGRVHGRCMRKLRKQEAQEAGDLPSNVTFTLRPPLHFLFLQ